MLTILYFAFVTALLFAVLRLTCGPCVMGHDSSEQHAPTKRLRLPVVALGWTLSLFLTVTYVICVGFDLMFPAYAMYEAWIGFMPGMSWLTFGSFLIGLLWAFFYGWYTALLFGGLFNAIFARA